MAIFKLKRDDYIQKDLHESEQNIDGIVYFGERSGSWYAQGFSGKRTKPDFHHKYRTEEHMSAAIKNYFQNLAANREYKDRSRSTKLEAGKKFLETLKPGVILYDTWGYEQTNVEFFEVKEVNGHKVTLHELAHNDLEATSWASCKVVPKKGHYIGGPITKIVKGDRVRVNDCVSLTLYDDRPIHKSWYA
jgi:hypothetical protein